MDQTHARLAVAGGYWPLLLTAAGILAINMGARQSLGLFVAPLDQATGLGVVSISFAMAIGQFVWGASQPVFGAFADRYGAGRVIVVGGVMMALGTALTPFVRSEFALTATLGLLMAAGAGAGSFSIVIGVTGQRVPSERRAFAAGFVNAGGSFGQFVFAPFVQAVISAFGWVAAMFALATVALATLPMARVLGHRPATMGTAGPSAGATVMTLGAQLREAARDRSYWCLHAGFFTCGFHIAFLVTHLPGEVHLCGLPAQVAATSLAIIGLANIAGSLGAGWLGGLYRMKMLLFWAYFSRAVIIGLYLLSPRDALSMYVFSAALGLTWLSTVPPTAGLVGKLFGTRFLSTLFGLTLLSHQIGAFFGAWLGGLAFARFGSYEWMWLVDILLALLAAVVNLPIREARLVRFQEA